VLGLPAAVQETVGQLAPERGVGDGDDPGVLAGETFQPCRGFVDASRLRWRGVLAAESQEKGSAADGNRPGRERKAKPAEARAFEIELAQQGRDDDLALGRQHPRRGDGTGSVAGNHQIGLRRQLRERGWNALGFPNAGRFVGLAPRAEAGGVDPAGVDVRRAAVTDEGDSRC
jgi:hypothetical protein